VTRARYLRHASLEKLREEVPENLAAYHNGDFNYLLIDNSLFFEGKADIDTKNLSKLSAPDDGELRDVENCQACFTSMSELSPYEARDERLWAYVTHTYMLIREETVANSGRSGGGGRPRARAFLRKGATPDRAR
jgi:hypothetical protein